jgi:hypothetical protein
VIAFTIVGTTFAAIPFTCIAFASLTLPTGFTALLNAATPLFTAALGVVVLRQALSGRMIAGLADRRGRGARARRLVAPRSDPGDAHRGRRGLGAPASYAVAGTYVRARLSDVPGVELATGMLLMGALVTLPVAVLTGARHADDGRHHVAGRGRSRLDGARLARVLPRPARSTPTVASTVTFIVPVFAAAWGALVLGEAVGLELVAAFGLVLVSLLLVLGLTPGVPVDVGAPSRGGTAPDRRLTRVLPQAVVASPPVPMGTATSESGSTSSAS